MAGQGDQDSLSEGLGQALGSRQAKSMLRSALPYLLWALSAAVTSFGGWVVKSYQVERQFTDVRLMLTEQKNQIESLRVELRQALAQQPEILRVGKQAAFATAGFQAYESSSRKKLKTDYATKYANAYETLAQKKGAEVAYADLFANVALP